MAHVKTLTGIGYAWFALLAFGGPVARSQQADLPKDLPAAQEETKESAWLHGIFSREISEYDFYLDAEKQQKLVLLRKPVLRYPTPVDFWGETYVWTYRGRPAVVGSVFAGKEEKPSYRIFHEFHSLSSQPLVTGEGATGWQPDEAGITFKPVPDTAEPAKDEAGRLSQMRDIAGRFSSCMIWVDTMLDLQLLPNPFYRYELTDKDSVVVDGALFAFSGMKSKDPEVLLVIEAQRTDSGVRWQYAPVRFTNRKAWLKYQGVEVWRADAGSVGIFDGVTTKRYGVFLVKRITREDDEK